MTALTPVDGNGPGQLNIAARGDDRRTTPTRSRRSTCRSRRASLGTNAAARGEDPRRGPVGRTDRPRGPDRQGAQVVDLQVRHRRHRPAVRRLSSGRVLRHLQEGLLPVLRDHDGGHPARPGCPDPDREGFLPGRATKDRPPRRSCSAMPTPGSRSTSRATAGSRSIRPAVLSQIGGVADGPAAAQRRTASLGARVGRSRAGPRGRARRGRRVRLPPDAARPARRCRRCCCLVVGAVAFVVWQRGPRGPTSADDAYGTVTRIASRFGFGPRPNQTVYEYAGVLSDVLPIVRPELETVARAKVESSTPARSSVTSGSRASRRPSAGCG